MELKFTKFEFHDQILQSPRIYYRSELDNTKILVHTGTIISYKLLKILIVIRIISNLNYIKLDIILIEKLYIVNNNYIMKLEYIHLKLIIQF